MSPDLPPCSCSTSFTSPRPHFTHFLGKAWPRCAALASPQLRPSFALALPRPSINAKVFWKQRTAHSQRRQTHHQLTRLTKTDAFKAGIIYSRRASLLPNLTNLLRTFIEEAVYRNFSKGKIPINCLSQRLLLKRKQGKHG